MTAPDTDGGERPLEIIQLVRSAGPHGGTGGVAFALGRAFDALGVQNRLVTLADFSGGVALLSRPPRGKALHLVQVVWFSVAASLWLARRRRGAVVINHGDAVGGEVFVNHGLHRALVRRRPAMLLRNPLHLFIALRETVRHVAGGYSVAVCLSDGGAAELRRLHPPARRARIAVVANGVDLARFTPRPGYADAVPEVFRLIFVGHEFGRKGLGFVLSALARLPGRVRLTVVGGTPGQVAAARRRAAAAGVLDRTELLGARQDVPELMREADLLVLPSLAEAWPLVALEAMASGAPVLLGPVVSAPELVGDGLAGEAVARDGADIARSVSRLLDDPDRYLALRRGAVEKAARYGWPTIARRYVELCREVQDRAEPPGPPRRLRRPR